MSDPVGRYLATYTPPSSAPATGSASPPDPVAAYHAKYAPTTADPVAAYTARYRNTAPPVQQAPGLAAGMFAPMTFPQPVGPSGQPLPALPAPAVSPETGRQVSAALGRTNPRLGDALTAAVAGSPTATGVVPTLRGMAGQVVGGTQQFARGVGSGLATFPTEAAHGLISQIGAPVSILAAEAAGNPAAAYRLRQAARQGQLTAPVDAATQRIQEAFGAERPLGHAGQIVGGQIPAVLTGNAVLGSGEGVPVIGRILQGAGAGGVAGAVSSPTDPLRGITYGVPLGLGAETLVQGLGAGLRYLRGTPEAEAPGIPATGDRRVAVDIPGAPKPFIRRVTDRLDPEGAAQRDLNPKTGLASQNIWQAVQPQVDAHPDLEVVSADSRSLKKLNDTVSPEAGDVQIRRQADAYRQAVVEAGLDPRKVLFTPKGDELYAVVPRGLGDAIGARATDLMGEAPVSGIRTGTRFGVGATTAEADQALNAAKGAEKGGPPPESPPATSEGPPPPAGPSGEAGVGRLPLLGATAGGLGGAATGYATGTTPEERARNAIIGGLAGVALGGVGGLAAEQAGEARAGRTAGLPVGEPVPEGVQGPIRGPETNRIGNLDLSPEAAARVENYARQVAPPGYESWASLDDKVQRARASQVGLTASDIASWKRSGLDRVQIGAMNQVLLENQARLDQLAPVLTDPATPAATRAAAAAEKQMLDRQSFDLFQSITRQGGTEAGRTLAALKKTWSVLGNTDAAWELRGQDVAGRPLTAVERTKLLAFKQAGQKAQALAYLGTLRPQGTLNQVLSQWKAGLLGLSSLAAKTSGDVLQGITTDAARVAGSPWDYLLSLATRERTMAPTFNLAERLRGAFGPTGRQAFSRAVRGLPSVAEEAVGDVPYNTTVGPTVLSRAVGGAGVGSLTGAITAGPGHRLKGAGEGALIGAGVAAAVPPTGPILNALYQGPFRLLKGVSEQFSAGAVRASLANQAAAVVRQAGLPRAQWASAIAQLVARPTEEMQVKAAQDALYDTMTNDTRLAQAGRAVQHLPGGQVIVPFNKTPMSMTTKLAVDENPLVALPTGAVRAVQVMRKGVQEIARTGAVSGATRQAQYEAARYLGQGTVMALPFAYGYLKMAAGEASGTVDPSQRGARGLRQETQTPDDAFLIGGRWVKMTRLGMPGQIAALGANVYAATHPEPDATGQMPGVGSQVLAGAQAVGRQALDNPFFVGVNQASQLATGGENAVVRYGHNLASSLVPSVVRNTANALDPIQRRVTSPAEAFTRSVPRQSKTLFPQRGRLGEALPKMVTGPQALGSPLTVTTPGTLPPEAAAILTEWNRLGVGLTPPQQVRGETNAAYDARMQALGAEVRKLGTFVLAHPVYQRMTPEERTDYWKGQLGQLTAGSTQQAKMQVRTDSLQAAR